MSHMTTFFVSGQSSTKIVLPKASHPARWATTPPRPKTCCWWRPRPRNNRSGSPGWPKKSKSRASKLPWLTTMERPPKSPWDRPRRGQRVGRHPLMASVKNLPPCPHSSPNHKNPSAFFIVENLVCWEMRQMNFGPFFGFWSNCLEICRNIYWYTINFGSRLFEATLYHSVSLSILYCAMFQKKLFVLCCPCSPKNSKTRLQDDPDSLW